MISGTITVNTRDIDSYEENTCKLGYREADEENCGKYLECVADVEGNHVMKTIECPYPALFDETTLKCDAYHKVTCEPNQIVPKSQCKFFLSSSGTINIGFIIKTRKKNIVNPNLCLT